MIAIMAGSTARGERTRTSDIDLLVIGEGLFAQADQGSAATCEAFEGEIVEVFAYTPAAFETWAQRDLDQFRPVVVNMLLDGVVVRGSEELVALRARWDASRAAGPVIDPHELDLRRYIVTDLLDDLRDATDAAERLVVAGALFERTAQLMLLRDRRWVATGKHLPRVLRAMDAARAEALIAPLLSGDSTRFADAVEDELMRAGGRLQTGFVR
ncbi:hypothetical protein GCM10025768_11850 [Microbacterium pseudoresistens]